MHERILVTGGSGFIGSNLLAYLDGMAKFELANIDVVPPTDPKFADRWQNVDLLNEQALTQTVNDFKPDYVFHLAARTDLKGESPQDYSVNESGTRNLIEACKSTDSVKKIVFASSMLVCQVGYIPQFDTDYNANTFYGASKVNMEKLIRSEKQPWQWVIVRPTSIWGPGFKEPYRDFFELVLRGRFLDIGKKYSTKTYGYIGNTVYQLFQILITSGTDQNTYYLGDSPPIFISDWGKEVAQAAGRSNPLRIPYAVIKTAALIGDRLGKMNISFPMTSFRLTNMITDNVIDLAKLYKIAPAPPYSRQEGIKETVNWLTSKAGKK